MSDIEINQSVGTRSYADSIAPGYEIASRRFTLLSGQSVEALEVVALNGDSKIITYNAGGGSPGNVAYGLAVTAATASGGDGVVYVYTKGAFYQSAVVFSDSDDSVTQAVYDALRTRGIELLRSQAG